MPSQADRLGETRAEWRVLPGHSRHAVGVSFKRRFVFFFCSMAKGEGVGGGTGARARTCKDRESEEREAGYFVTKVTGNRLGFFFFGLPRCSLTLPPSLSSRPVCSRVHSGLNLMAD